MTKVNVVWTSAQHMTQDIPVIQNKIQINTEWVPNGNSHFIIQENSRSLKR